MVIYDTDSVAYKVFKPHGRIEFSVISDQILLFKATGPFNKESMDALEKIEPQVIQNIKEEQGNWCEVIVFEESCVALQDFLLELTRFSKEEKENSLAPLATAFVISDQVEGSSFMPELYDRCFKEAGLDFATFENVEDAIQWVKSYLPPYNTQ